MKFQLVMLLLFLTLVPTFGEAITLEDYLTQVQIRNGGVRGTKVSADAKALRKDEGTLFFKPSFFLTGEYFDDQRTTTAPAFQGSQTIRHTIRTGLAQNFRTGTKASLSYNQYKTQINGANPALLPTRKFFDVAPTIEVTQSLWRNFLGSEFEATENLHNSQTEALHFAEEFNYKQLIMRAENAYWKLYFAQTSLTVIKDSLERAHRLREWNAGRVRSNLVDETELLQAEANLQNREIEYQDTQADIDTALREFNSFREGEGDINLEGTKDKESGYILNAQLPPKAAMREDVKAALASQRAAEANAALGTQRNRPNLELYGSYSANGRDAQDNDAFNESMSGRRPFTIVGVRFTTPLDIASLSDYKTSYGQEASAAQMNYRRKVYEVEREWEILRARFENFKERLRMTQKLEKVQEKKLLQEKRRYSAGRTTTFQVLQFEQDYANTQLFKLRFERELITVYNQLKLFSGDFYE